MRVMISKQFAAAAIILAAVGLLPRPAAAVDPENCLGCHRYRGLARIAKDDKTIRLFYVDPNYFDRDQGAHARLWCTYCHDRSEVGVIPHKPVSPVNCEQACHITDLRNIEVRFSHEGVAGMLDASVHGQAILDESNALLGQPLREGQARCLLCHDEPIFGQARGPWVLQAAPVQRCSVCHAEVIPINTTYAYWHVESRSRPARTPTNLTKVCATCHDSKAIREKYRMPDTVASYLASFHGKAMQLGSTATATCLNCHVGEMQNVHMMESHKDPHSPTYPPNLAGTCRSPACHPTAGPAVSTAAVHLDLATTRGVEHFIGALFIILIICTFGPSVVLQTLEMLQIVVGREDPRHHQRRRLAERLMAVPAGRQALKRFNPHQRAQHWVLAICFTLLVLTGFPIKFADRAWASWIVNLFGGLTVTRWIHRYAGLILLLGLAYHLVYVGVYMWQRKRATKKGWIRTLLEMPMVMNPHDVREVFTLLRYLLFMRRTRPDADRFSAEEKFEYFGVFWGTVLLGFTGMLMWHDAWTTEHLTGRILTIAMVIHTFEAFLALLHVGIIHMIGVIFSPAVFPVSPAMVTGDTPADEYAEAHSGMLERVGRQMGVVGEEVNDG